MAEAAHAAGRSREPAARTPRPARAEPRNPSLFLPGRGHTLAPRSRGPSCKRRSNRTGGAGRRSAPGSARRLHDVDVVGNVQAEVSRPEVPGEVDRVVSG